MTKKPHAGIHTDDLHETFPDQAALLAQARGRMSSYLSAQRPQPAMGQPVFDSDPDKKVAEKSYNRALQIAVSPLSIMKKIGDGSLVPEDIKHGEAMYPELMDMLRKKATDRMMKDKLDKKKPPYKVRQSLSLFMGATLTGDLAPAAIQAAQATFAPKQGPQTPQGQGQGDASKGSKRSLSKSDQSYLTDDQARMKRQQRV